MAGDLSLPHLGLSPEDVETIKKNVKVFINCAASVDFVINVETALTTNIYGTLRMLELAQQCPEPPNFVHISTAFVSSNRLYPFSHFSSFFIYIFRGFIEEKFTPYSGDIEAHLKDLERLAEKTEKKGVFF